MPVTQADFEYVRALVWQRSAVVLEPDKAYLVEARLAPLAQAEGLPSVSSLVARLGAAPANGLARRVVEAMTINETSFFRDPPAFDALRRVVLPGLVRRRAAERGVRLWSAACSSGQEPYSLALLLREHRCLPDGWEARLLATGFCTAMVERARQGRYTQREVNRGLPAALLVKNFRRQGLEWQVKEEVRRAVDFRVLNLAEPWPALPPMDVVFLRNVLIYFDVPTKQRVLANVRRLLRPDGYLFLGGAETTLNLDDGYERVAADRVSCYRPRGG
jgi:chemotaxis protein methyltransferase CheR